MPVTLPAIGTISYGPAGSEYTFGTLTETVGLEARAQWDASNRTIMYVTHRITLRTIIAVVPPGTTDTTMAGVRRTLMKAGQPLKYQDKGWGDLVVNVNGQAVKDVAFGPRPVSISFKPLGGRNAIEMTWTVETSIPECANAAYANAVAELAFKVDYAIDRLGNTRRTFSGFLRIANNQTNRRPNDTADRWREKFVPDVPANFRRVDQRFETSEDKSRLTVTIVDESLPSPNVPPPGVVDVNFKHSIANEGPKAWTRQIGTLTGNYTLAAGVPASQAMEHFFRVIEDRVLGLYREVKPANPNAPMRSGEIRGIIPLMSRTTEEDAYGPGNRVTAEFSYLVITSPTLFLTKGMWRPLPNSNYRLWAKSMAGVWGPRGTAGAGLAASDDAIIDLCLGQNSPIMRSLATREPPDNFSVVRSGLWPTPPPDGSWVDIRLSLKLEVRDSVLRHVPLDSGTSRLSSGGTSSGGTSTLRTPLAGEDTFGRMAAVAQGKDDPTIQTAKASLPTLILEGWAVRAGWEIACPTIVGAFGRAAVPANREGDGFESALLPMSGPVPIVAARFRQRFHLLDAPPTPPVLPGGRPVKKPKPRPQNQQLHPRPEPRTDLSAFELEGIPTPYSPSQSPLQPGDEFA